ncbi:hypothetical protein [Actinocorallia herbida]|uniref:hypothetical protein n=1 Tax=Actinocorallia herbida TaxID=58109 RepID=UPI0011CE5AB1|nr:hypothetical protein [Actinocorallia herbida]
MGRQSRGGRVRRAAAAGLAGVLLVGTASAGSVAQAAGSGGEPERAIEQASGYRWTKLHTGSSSSTLLAAGDKDLWRFSGRYPDGGYITPLAWHWDGKTWRKSALPKKAKGAVERPAASSPRDVWVSLNSGVDSYGYATFLHWNGKTWKISKVLPKYSSYAAGPVLPFKSGKAAGFFGQRLWLYDGGTWRESRADREVYGASGVSPGDLWAIGGWGNPKVYRFDGGRWKAGSIGAPLKIDPAPCLKERPNKSFSCSGTLIPTQTLAQSSRRVLAVTTTEEWPTERWRVVRWNGRSWSKLTGTYKGVVGHAVDDGTGGLWSVVSDATGNHVVHVTGKGRVVEYASPAKDIYLGSLSVSPSGTVFVSGDREGDGYTSYVWRLTR